MFKDNMNKWITGHVVSQNVIDNVPSVELVDIMSCLPKGFSVFLEDEIDGVEPNVAMIGKDERGRWCISKIITEKEAREAKEALEKKMYEVTVVIKKVVSVSAESKDKASEYAVNTMKREYLDVNEFGGIDTIAVLSVEEWGKR